MWIAEPAFSEAEVGSVSAPTLIIVGDGDIVTPEHAVEMFRTIPDSHLCIVPGAGHGVMPRETVLAFLSGTAADDELAATASRSPTRRGPRRAPAPRAPVACTPRAGLALYPPSAGG